MPRPSKKEEKIREFLVDFAKKHNIDYQTDQTGNVVMRVPGTKGYENRPCVILQSHMDMVCEKNSDTAFDFDKDPIRTKIVDGWVKAEGTTLGADDGIGMAAALAALLDPALEHGPLEALFTVDEETGLTGAFGLGKGMLTGRYLVNLDSEDEGEIFIGCAGGVDTLAMFRYKTEAAPEGHVFFRVRVSDLSGGHSGDDIDKGRMNSNKLVARLLWNGAQRFGLRLSRFDGGNLRNAIPREAYAVFAVPSGSKAGFEAFYKEFAGELAAEAKFREPNFKIYASQMIESVFALAGAEVSHSEGYPGWAPNPQSKLLEITVASYEKLFGVKPKVRAIHAGLECGLFLEKYPHLEMVSFGPTLRGVHSPDERLEIATVPKFWDLLADILKKVE